MQIASGFLIQLQSLEKMRRYVYELESYSRVHNTGLQIVNYGMIDDNGHISEHVNFPGHLVGSFRARALFFITGQSFPFTMLKKKTGALAAFSAG